jgi:proline dehydrogenase
MGYEGVILSYAREIVVNKNTAAIEAVRPRRAKPEDEAVWDWRDGNLRTLSMLGLGDFLAVKCVSSLLA